MSQENESAIEKFAGTQVSFVMPNTDELGSLETMEDKFSLVLKYKTQEDWFLLKDKEVRAFFMGTKQIPNSKGELVLCAIFASKTECFLAAQMVLIEAVQNLPKNTAVKIVFRGKKPNASSDGGTNLFDVNTIG